MRIYKYFILACVMSPMAYAGEAINNVTSHVDSTIESWAKQNISNLRLIEVETRIRNYSKTDYRILGMTELSGTNNEKYLSQFSFSSFDSTETLNLGVVWRKLNVNQTLMYGYNAFYDYEIDYDHQRASIGGEIKSSILELNTNHYFAISNEVTGKNNIKEEVADGYDLEFGAHVPYMPTAKMYAKIFEYDIPGGSDYEGVEYSSNIGIPNSGMNFEVGYKDYGNNGYDDQWFFNLTFSLSKMNPNTSFVSDQAFERVSMKDKKYEKVRRENIIVKSKAFSVKAGGL